MSTTNPHPFNAYKLRTPPSRQRHANKRLKYQPGSRLGPRLTKNRLLTPFGLNRASAPPRPPKTIKYIATKHETPTPHLRHGQARVHPAQARQAERRRLPAPALRLRQQVLWGVLEAHWERHLLDRRGFLEAIMVDTFGCNAGKINKVVTCLRGRWGLIGGWVPGGYGGDWLRTGISRGGGKGMNVKPTLFSIVGGGRHHQVDKIFGGPFYMCGRIWCCVVCVFSQA